MNMSCTGITYCVPSTPCANKECPRHSIHAPVGLAGISTSDLWPTCAIKKAYPNTYPIYSMANVSQVGGVI